MVSTDRSEYLLMETAPTPAVPPKTHRSSRPAARMPGEDRRRQLLRVAVESFARNGFSGTKTKDIAAAAGVSEAILFRHFASKEDLYHAILDEKEATMGGERWFVEMNELAERRDDRGLFQHVARQIDSLLSRRRRLSPFVALCVARRASAGRPLS